MSHRALIFGSLAHGQSVVHGLLESDDIFRTASAVRAFGASLDQAGSGSWILSGTPWRTPERLIDCGNSGTAARLLIGAAAAQPVTATFTGDGSLSARPMARIIDPLLAMGAEFDRHRYLPITVHGRPLKGISYRSPVASAQVKSAILLAGLQTAEHVEIIEPVPSRDHSEQMLRHFGCDVEAKTKANGHRVRLGANRTLRGRHVLVPGDPSSAAFALVAALITPNSEIVLQGILDSPTRNGLLVTLAEMGGDVAILDRRTVGGLSLMDVRACTSELRGVSVPATRAPSMIDEYPVLAIAAAFANGETVMNGLSELRVKESDRLASLEAGLLDCGVNAFTAGDALHVVGTGEKPGGGADIETRGDHRIGMAFLVLGLGSEQPVTIDRAEMIATSFPGFASFMNSLGADIAQC